MSSTESDKTAAVHLAASAFNYDQLQWSWLTKIISLLRSLILQEDGSAYRSHLPRHPDDAQ